MDTPELFSENDDYTDDEYDNQNNNQDENQYIQNNNIIEEIVPNPNNILNYTNNNDEDTIRYLNLLKYFNLEVMEYIYSDTYKYLSTLYQQKLKIQIVKSNWFKDDEKQNIINDNYELSIYIIQLITDNIINISNKLREEYYNSDEDINSINNIGINIQKWINEMENENNGYVLDIIKIGDIQTLIYWIILMITPYKYIDKLLNYDDCPYDIFTEKYLLRVSDNINLLLMSLYNTNIRKTIINKIGKDTYTKYLNLEYDLTDNVKIQYLELSIYYGTYYKMLIEDDIDINHVDLKNYNILSLLFKLYSPDVISLRKSFSQIKFDEVFPTLDDINDDFWNLLPINTINKMKELKYQVINKYTPINHLYNLIRNDVSQYLILNKLSSYIYDDAKFINHISLNSYSPYEIMLNIINFKDSDYDELCHEELIKYIKYFDIIVSNFLDIDVIKNTFKTFVDYCNKKNIKNNLKYYIENYYNNIDEKLFLEDMIKSLENNDFEDVLNIFNKLLTQKNYYKIIINLIDKQIYYNFIKFYINYKNNTIREDNLIYITFIDKILIDYKDNSIYLLTLLNNIYFKYFKFSYKYFFQTDIDKYIDKIYDIQYYSDRLQFSNLIIKQLLEDEDNINFANNTLNNLIYKYLEYICCNLDEDKFKKFIEKLPEFTMELIKSDKISLNIKFGSLDDSIDNFNYVFTKLYTNINFELKDIDNYIINNSIRIVNYLTSIKIDDILINFIKLFKIDQHFCDIYNVKKIYIDNIINKTLDPINLKYIISSNLITFYDTDIDIDKFIEIKDINCVIIFKNIIINNNISIDNLKKILNNPEFNLDFNDTNNYNILDLYLHIIKNYKDDYIFNNVFNRYINYDLSIKDINKLDIICDDMV
jgi:hypothetical protein